MDWRALEARVDAVQRRAWGEEVRIVFMDKGNVDVERLALDVRAVLYVDDKDDDKIGPGDHFRGRVAHGVATLVLNRDEYTGPVPREKDRVRANDRAGQPVFEVRSVDDRHSNLIVVKMSEV